MEAAVAGESASVSCLPQAIQPPMAAPKPKPMVPNPAGGQKTAGLFEIVKQGCPHLVLAHVGGHRGVVLGVFRGFLQLPFGGQPLLADNGVCFELLVGHHLVMPLGTLFGCHE